MQKKRPPALQGTELVDLFSASCPHVLPTFMGNITFCLELEIFLINLFCT